ncbi:MAG: cupin domain-containing protein [Desulfobacteraceae bacterium]|jgi:quercetin dioxygenase-like cupin family protein
MSRRKFKFIKKPSWFGDEGPIYENADMNETLRVLFDQKTNDVKQMSVWETTFPPGVGIPLHKHPYPVEELLYILRGTGIETVGDEQREVGPGSAVFIPPEVEHNIVNTGDEMLMLLVVVSPPGVVEKELYQNRLKKVTQVWKKEYL